MCRALCVCVCVRVPSVSESCTLRLSVCVSARQQVRTGTLTQRYASFHHNLKCHGPAYQIPSLTSCCSSIMIKKLKTRLSEEFQKDYSTSEKVRSLNMACTEGVGTCGLGRSAADSGHGRTRAPTCRMRIINAVQFVQMLGASV